MLQNQDPKQNMNNTNGQNMRFRTSSFIPMATYLVMYLFVSSQILPRSNAAQKFYPNGRYGRRSDLPPLLYNLKGSNHFDADNGGQQNPDLAYKLSLVSANLIDINGMSLWCAPLDAKTNLYRCFDRYSMMNTLSHLASNNKPIEQISIRSSPNSDQEQS